MATSREIEEETGIRLNIKEVEPSGIKSTANDVHSVTSYYNLDGQKIDIPKKGINIFKMNNGSYKKVFVK